MELINEVLEELSPRSSRSVQDKFYRVFSNLDCKHPHLNNVIEKTWTLIKANTSLSRSILYLSLIAKGNFGLLIQCIEWEKSNFNIDDLEDPNLLFNHTVFTKGHWFYHLISAVPDKEAMRILPQVYDKLPYLRLIDATRDMRDIEFQINRCHDTLIDDFWLYYVNELKHIMNVLKLCKNNNAVKVACQNSILRVASDTLDLKDYADEVKDFLCKDLKLPHEEDVTEQQAILSFFIILIKVLKLLSCHNTHDVSVTEELKNIQTKLLELTSNSLQLELMQLVFSMLFLKHSHFLPSNSNCSYICKEKEAQTLLYMLKSFIDHIKFSQKYDNDNLTKLNELHKEVKDGAWRLELVCNVVDEKKRQENLLRYMLAGPEALINLCVKNGDFTRAHQVLQIFNLEDSSLAKQVIFAERLQELAELFKKTFRMREIEMSSGIVAPSNVKLQLDVITKDFFQKYPVPDQFINILDLALTRCETPDDCLALLRLASSSEEWRISQFKDTVVELLSEIKDIGFMTNPLVPLEANLYTSDLELLETLKVLYKDFTQTLAREEPAGTLNNEHPSHRLLQDISNLYPEGIKYLEKLFNYLKAFSKVLYIEKDSTEIITNGFETSFFDFLFHNRSELMGHLLFKENLEPAEFEKHFLKLKLDFLYHVAGNCFPTVNIHSAEYVEDDELYPENVLYPPTSQVITYIKKRNWLLALILIVMYKMEGVELEGGESRIQHFINYLRLPKIDSLQALFNNNEIVTALQNEIGIQKLEEFVQKQVEVAAPSLESMDVALEIDEDKLKSTNWKRIYDIVDAIPENHVRKDKQFVKLKDNLLKNLVNDSFECECYKFVLNIRDKAMRRNLLLENMKTWPESFCILAINIELSSFEDAASEEEQELRFWLKHIELSKKVMTVIEASNWSEMYDMCTFNKKQVLHKLLSSNQVDLLAEFLQLHEVSPALLSSIDEFFLEHAFDMNVDLKYVNKLLDLLPKDQASMICTSLLTLLKSVTHLQFVSDYLARNLGDDDDDLKNIVLSLKMLSVFSNSELDQQLLFLLREPLAILEVLLMNTKLDKLSLMMDIVRREKLDGVDELLRKYAEKSLDFRVIDQPPDSLATCEQKLLQSIDSFDLNLDFHMPEEVPTKQDWVPNSSVQDCMCCRKVVFSMFNRHHHCRRCGRVVCASCSTKRMHISMYGDILVRVCADCFSQTFSEDEALSLSSLQEDYWMLTNDLEHNKIVRQEFNYEFAPSVSLCLALMKFHLSSEEEYKFLVRQCEILLKLLIPCSQRLDQETDYLLLIRMLKSLALAAEMAALKCNDQPTSANWIRSQAEILTLLAERGCLDLLPITNCSLIDATCLRGLTDKLLEKEQWSLALEIATKAGNDRSGIFAAWGVSCLKAGVLITAREKFGKCLDKNLPEVVQNPSLLNEIIKILESMKDRVDQELVSRHQEFLDSPFTRTPRVSPPDAVFIQNKLNNLKFIECRNYTYKCTPTLDPVIYNECVYYLNRYGTSLTLVEFHIKYGNFDRAVNCIRNKGLSPHLFVDIYMKCLKAGSILLLQACMSEVNPSLIIWKDHLETTCSHLVNLNMLHSLYQVQCYMGDHVRAAMTCVRFYKDKANNFKDLLDNIQFLENALGHLEQAKDQRGSNQWVAVTSMPGQTIEETTTIASALVKKMSPEEIDRHIATIRRQIEVTRFLANCPYDPMEVLRKLIGDTEDSDNVEKSKSIPTLIGSDEQQRKYILVLGLVCADNIEKGFEFSTGLLKSFKKMKPFKVYKEAGIYLAQSAKFGEIATLVECIKKSQSNDLNASEVCDEMLIFALAALKNTNPPEEKIKDLIKLISDKSAKISAYIEVHKLTDAYCLAAKYEKLIDFKRFMLRIKYEAEQTNQPQVKRLCEKALKNACENKAVIS